MLATDSRLRLLTVCLILLASATVLTSRVHAAPGATSLVSWKVFATGLENPRGLRFGPDGALYVAEGGRGGSHNTTEQDCTQVPVPSGPYSGGMTARISRITPDGKRATIIDGLPSTQTSPKSGSDVSGIADVAFLDGALYALTAGAGCSHGNKDTVNALLRITTDSAGKQPAQATQVADLSGFLIANPVKTIEDEDFEPDGDFYSMIVVDDKFYLVEANHGELDEVTPDGQIRRIIDISASQGHVVPTAIAYKDGNFYVATLSTFPVQTGAARLYKISPDGNLTVLAPHLTAVLGLAFDAQGQLYGLETSTVENQFPVAHTGAVVRIQPDSEKVDIIASGLTYPTGMTFGPDGMLYVSNFGFGSAPGSGQIVRMVVSPSQN